MTLERRSRAGTWGTDASERASAFPCDLLLDSPDERLYRGVTIAAPAQHVFRWLCQLRAAPYSYDWLDNGGRRSPPALTPGLELLAIGQDVMRIFTLVDFGPNVHLTIRIKPGSGAFKTFGDVVGSYLVLASAPTTCRLLVKLAVRYPRGAAGFVMRHVLPWGDMLMMRRQLLNLKALAEG